MSPSISTNRPGWGPPLPLRLDWVFALAVLTSVVLLAPSRICLAGSEPKALAPVGKSGETVRPIIPPAPSHLPRNESRYLSREERRRARLVRALAPPPPGRVPKISLGLSFYPVVWNGKAGHGPGAPDYLEAFNAGFGTRIGMGFSLFPSLEMGMSLGYEFQKGNRFRPESAVPWTVNFEDRAMIPFVLEVRFQFPILLHRYKWFRSEWAGRSRVLPFITPLRLGMLWHGDVDAVVNDPTPPPITDVRTSYYRASSALLYEFVVGFEYRRWGFGIILEVGWRWATAPKEAPNSILTNGSGAMSHAFFGLGGSYRF